MGSEFTVTGSSGEGGVMTCMRRVWIAFVVGVFTVGMFTVGTAHGATVRALSNKAMAESADVIARGRCVGLRSAWQGRTLVTLATIAVAETLKGDASATLTVTLPGGVDLHRKFPIAAVYDGAPQIVVQEEVFLFLARRPAFAGEHTVLGFSQGKFSIVQNARGQRMVSRNLAGVMVKSPAGTRQGAVSDVPLEAFTQEIRTYLAGR
jgi:hypothetical protein